MNCLQWCHSYNTIGLIAIYTVSVTFFYIPICLAFVFLFSPPLSDEIWWINKLCPFKKLYISFIIPTNQHSSSVFLWRLPRTLSPAGPHFFVQLLLSDHPQVETSQWPQWQHHSLPGLLPAPARGQRALQVRLLSEGWATLFVVFLFMCMLLCLWFCVSDCVWEWEREKECLLTSFH